MTTPIPSVPLIPLTKGAPIAPAGQPYAQIMPSPVKLVWDTAASSEYGAVYNTWSHLLAVASEFPGPVEIYVANGSIIPAGNWTVQGVSWKLSSDSQGITFASGCYFTTNPVEISPESNGQLVFQESNAGKATFTMTSPLTALNTTQIKLGTNGYAFDGTAGGSLVMRTAQVISTGGQTLLNGSSINNITLLNVSQLLNNNTQSTVNVFYDPTSTPATQNGSVGTPLFTALQGPQGIQGLAGATGPAGPAGAAGGVAYLPAAAPPNGTVNNLYVDSSGNEFWVPTTGFGGTVTSGQATQVEIGTSVASITYGNNYNFTPTAITVTLTPPTGGTQTLNTATGTFTGPFTSSTQGQTCQIHFHCTDPDGGTHDNYFTVTWCTRVVWGSAGSQPTPPTVNAALYTSLVANASVLDPGGGHANMSFNSTFGQYQCFGRLATEGTSNFTVVGGGENYTAQYIGSAVGGTVSPESAETYAYFIVGAPGQTGFSVSS